MGRDIMKFEMQFNNTNQAGLENASSILLQKQFWFSAGGSGVLLKATSAYIFKCSFAFDLSLVTTECMQAHSIK